VPFSFLKPEIVKLAIKELYDFLERIDSSAIDSIPLAISSIPLALPKKLPKESIQGTRFKTTRVTTSV
jgi:hypothetical protein